MVLYWYETATFNVNNETQQKHVKISLIVYPKSSEDIRQYEELLLPIAKEVNDYWQPIKTWTTVALTISQNGLTLSAATIALLIALIIYRLIIYQQEKASLLILYSKLPTTKQRIIQAVQEAQKEGTPTTQGIVDKLNKQSNTKINPEELSQELLESEKVGLVQKILVNKEDKPAYAWKSNLSRHYLPRSLPIFSRFLK